MKLLVTGAGGLVGFESVKYFLEKGWRVVGLDNDSRSAFFGGEASVASNLDKLKQDKGFTHVFGDIRDQKVLEDIFREHSFDAIIHAAAQPSHDFGSKFPLIDFNVNATGTLNLLILTKHYCPDAVFCFTSTNKVYGDTPNQLPLIPDYKKGRYKLDINHKYSKGIDESMSIDQCTHSFFGCSKLYADTVCQEAGKNWGLKTGVFRLGCISGESHKGAELHGFLSYLVKCAVADKHYNVYGNGLAVRDNIHAYDLVTAFDEFIKNPKPGEVYNMGGGLGNSISIIEAIAYINKKLEDDGKPTWRNYVMLPDQWRTGDHKWWISSFEKFQKDYPEWPGITISVFDIIDRIYASCQ